MIDIVRQEDNNLYYECDCGSKGVCSFRALNKEATVIVDVRCPACDNLERITLLQYKDDLKRKEFIENPNNSDLSWTPSFSEELLRR